MCIFKEAAQVILILAELRTYSEKHCLKCWYLPAVDLVLLSLTVNLRSLTLRLRGSVKHLHPKIVHVPCIYVAYMHFFWKESHSFHYLLKFVKVKNHSCYPASPHIHRLNHSSHLGNLQFYIPDPEFPSNPHIQPSTTHLPLDAPQAPSTQLVQN